jgi:hypothetical protein
MATITGVSISFGGMVIATAQSGEIAPPPAANLTIENAQWAPGVTPKGKLDYLQKACRVTATAAGQPWAGNFTITGIKGENTIKLTAVTG